jgi:hypothetical protein
MMLMTCAEPMISIDLIRPRESDNWVDFVSKHSSVYIVPNREAGLVPGNFFL